MKFTLILAVMLFSSIGYSVEILKVSSKDSVITWRAEKEIGAKHFGTIKVAPNQTIKFEGGLPQSGEILIDMDSVFVQDLEKDSKMHKKLMAHLRSKDFFKVSKYKYSKLKILSSKKISENKIEVSTKLTIKKETRPLKLTLDLDKKDKDWKAKSKFSIDRKDWNLTYGAGWFSSKLDRIIKDTILFEIKIVVLK